MRPIGIDLFAGAGGLSLGFEQAGFDVLAAVEIDPIHCAVHDYNFPKCRTMCADVSKLSGSELRSQTGIGDKEIDVVFGGAPCQGFSLIGKRALDDPRNSLVKHFMRLVCELQPKYFVFENVKGLTVGGHKRFLTELMDEFEKNGYQIVRDYRVLNAAEYGVPQDRRRLFLLGARKGLKLPTYPEAMTKPPKADKRNAKLNGLPSTPTVMDALGDLPSIDKFTDRLLTTDTLKTKLGKPSKYARELRGLERAPNDFSYPRRYDSAALTGCLSTKHTPLSIKRFRATKPGEVEPISRFLRLDPNGVSNTLRAGTNSDKGAFTSPRPIHPVEPRCITNREAARLHSYPDWFRLHVTKWHGFRQIGNSVPPKLARAIAAQVIQALGVKPRVPRTQIALGDTSLLELDASAAAARYGVPADINGRRLRKG
jgi:DNA (cytosine-5)-methyltransferase 1